MMARADQRVALVTGANRGIGLEASRRLGARGWRVWLGARDLGKGQTAARDMGDAVSAVALDLADPNAPARLRDQIGPSTP